MKSKQPTTKAQRAAMRVQIAKDVIAQIHARKISPRTGAYIIKKSFMYPHPDTLDKVKRHCNVCAMGAAFLAHVERHNNFAEDQIENTGPHTICHQMNGYFPSKMLRQIESAFEYDWLYIPNDSDRLLAIMQNVIDHGGYFKIGVEYEVK